MLRRNKLGITFFFLIILPRREKVAVVGVWGVIVMVVLVLRMSSVLSSVCGGQGQGSKLCGLCGRWSGSCSCGLWDGGLAWHFTFNH
jgi:hypothetical protein